MSMTTEIRFDALDSRNEWELVEVALEIYNGEFSSITFHPDDPELEHVISLRGCDQDRITRQMMQVLNPRQLDLFGAFFTGPSKS